MLKKQNLMRCINQKQKSHFLLNNKCLQKTGDPPREGMERGERERGRETETEGEIISLCLYVFPQQDWSSQALGFTWALVQGLCSRQAS